MSLTISYDLSKDFSPALREVFEMLDDDQMKKQNKLAARDAVTASKAYHREFEGRGGWENPALPTHGSGRQKTGFGNSITSAWNTAEATARGFSISNDAPSFSHKVRGGTILPKKAKALTVPLIPEAHGVRAGDYPGDLFVPKGKSYLAEKVAGSSIRAVYALKKSITQDPWEGALPPDDVITEAVKVGYLERIGEALK